MCFIRVFDVPNIKMMIFQWLYKVFGVRRFRGRGVFERLRLLFNSVRLRLLFLVCAFGCVILRLWLRVCVIRWKRFFDDFLTKVSILFQQACLSAGASQGRIFWKLEWEFGGRGGNVHIVSWGQESGNKMETFVKLEYVHGGSHGSTCAPQGSHGDPRDP